MNHHTRFHVRSALRTLALVAGLALLPGLAEGRQGAFSSGGNDTIGSLPSTKGPGTQPGGQASGASGQTVQELPRLVLTGRLDDLRRMIVDASGAGSVQVEELEGGLVRLAFHGDVAVTLDRRLAQTSFVSAQVEIGPGFAGGLATFSVGGRPAAVQPLTLVGIDLRLQHALKAGLLERGLELATLAPQTAMPQRTFVLRSNGDLLRIQQGS